MNQILKCQTSRFHYSSRIIYPISLHYFQYYLRSKRRSVHRTKMPLLLSNFKCKLEHEIHKYCNFLIHEGESYQTLEPLALENYTYCHFSKFIQENSSKTIHTIIAKIKLDLCIEVKCRFISDHVTVNRRRFLLETVTSIQNVYKIKTC